MKKIIYIAFAAITLLSSCQIVDVLDKKPPYDADLDGAITNAKTAELALVGVYSYLPQGYFNWIDQAAYSFRSGIMSKPTWHNSGNMVYYYERNWPLLSSNVDTEWDQAYNIIKNANFLLTKVSSIGDFEGNRGTEIEGELYFLKAFAYHRLLLRYGQYWDLNSKYGLLIREDLPAIGGDKKARATVAESYNVILDNLNKAIEMAPAFSDSGYASSLAAKATKVKVLMDMGNYSECITLVDEVLKETTLEGSYADVFNNAATSKEIIFARKFGNSELVSLSTREDAVKGAKWGVTQTFMNLVEGDPRKSVIVGDSIKVAGATKPQRDSSMNAPVNKMSNSNNSLPIIFLRTAELYLIKAEATLRNNGSIADAWAPIMTLRNRAGATSTTPTTREELEEAICNEWIIELGYENSSEWLAIRRNTSSKFKDGDEYKTFPAGIAKLLNMNAQLSERYFQRKTAGTLDQFITDMGYKRILSIPTSETNSNPVEQNPGY